MCFGKRIYKLYYKQCTYAPNNNVNHKNSFFIKLLMKIIIDLNEKYNNT